MAELSPMMQQYMDMKSEYNDCLLLFRLGDFYELFFDDAITASKELSLYLTSRDCGQNKRAPMCGVPHHSVDTYINRLIENGHKVAICEQLTDPAEAKGLVERGVVRVITPGTVIEENILDENANSYICCAALIGKTCGYAYCDVSTGEFYAGEAAGTGGLLDLLNRIAPKEMLINKALTLHEKDIAGGLKSASPLVTAYDEWAFSSSVALDTLKNHFKIAGLEGFGISEQSAAINAAGALMCYLSETQKNALSHINRIRTNSVKDHMIVDYQTRRNLELVKSIREGGGRGTLSWLLNDTKTAMGTRLLKQWILEPLYSMEGINQRLDAVGELKSDVLLLDELRTGLGGFMDIERMAARLTYNSFDAKNCVSLKNTLSKLPALKKALEKAKAPLLKQTSGEIDTLFDIYELIERGVEDNPSAGINDGGIIKTGYNPEADELKAMSENGRQWILSLEEAERKETGIKNLKIGYNRVFGYYIEITKSNLSDVPYRYIRKQTLTNAERFVTPELKDMEEKLLHAEERLKKLEYQLFTDIRAKIAGAIVRLQATASAIARLDVLCSLAQVALNYGYTRPVITDDGGISIKNGRHPVVERSVSRSFVPNDTRLDLEDDMIMIITGPNMAGKSTYMRQVGLLTLMAHVGSFIPAQEAKICLTDRIFTRVGASDDLASGQSTFMVEMNEVSNILANATSRSLLILDEIGRGTSTFDGLSIAWAVVEYLSDKSLIGAKTLFATHYHELTELEDKLAGVKNYSITVREYGEDIVFLHKIVRGSAGQSFGIEVAKLAGLPEAVIARAKKILSMLLSADITKERSAVAHAKAKQLRLEEVKSASDEIVSLLRQTDTDNITPLQALGLICELKALL